MNSVRAHGVEIAYKRAGAGPPLVLIHGAFDDSGAWQPQLKGLADAFDIVAWDEPGAGGSAPPEQPFALADYADCLAGLIDALGLAPAHVGGLSWGGTVVLELYRRRPDLARTLILADTYAGWKGSLGDDEANARVAAVHEELSAMPLGARRDAIAAQASAMAKADQTDLLPHVDVPTLLIWGDRDQRSPLSVARQFQSAISRARLVVIPGAGHMSNLDRPDLFNAAVREFCAAN